MNRRNFFGGLFGAVGTWFGYNKVKAVESIYPTHVINFNDCNSLSDKEVKRFREEWEKQFKGPTDSGRFYVASSGAEIEQMVNRPVDMDYEKWGEEYQASWDQLVEFGFKKSLNF